jgi:hypothetical protein
MVTLSRKKMPIPPPYINGPENRGRPMKYPVRDMKVGWSFWVPLEGHQSANEVRARVSSAIGREKKREPTKDFTTRYLMEEGKRGVRVWRTK